jgi:aspartate/methionine/tyrosine aminotransferase
MFSNRLPAALGDNAISRALTRRRAAGAPVLDLTESNPTAVGLAYPEADILRAVAQPGALAYQPTPRGLADARAAIADYYLAQRQSRVDPERIILTASTSEAYGWLFKLLCNPGDDVLVPQPSYPLFDLLAGLEGVSLRPYPVRYDGAWFLDVDEIAEALSPNTRAILLVNPNNPTGSFLKAGELVRLRALCCAHQLALVSDEVFADYAEGNDPTRVATLVDEREVLTFSLSGLSKVAGLPQLKLGWIHIGGPPSLASDAQTRLEVIADTYLSVATPVQLGCASLLSIGETVRQQIVSRVRRGRAILASVLGGSAIEPLRAEGGWSAILRVPATRSDEDWVITLLEQDGLLVHPGFFYDFPRPAYLVICLLTPEAELAQGIERLRARVEDSLRAG